MTKEEAKTKWCPHMRAVPNAPNYAAGNRFDGPQPPIFQCMCIASDCMMWSEDTKMRIDEEGSCVDFKVIGGHCGLAK